MVSPTNLKISLSYITSRMRQTLVAVLSVTFGISMYIFMNSFMDGVNDTQSDMAFSTLAHVRVYNDVPEGKSNLMAKTLQSDEVVHIRNPRVIRYTENIKNSAGIIDMLSKDDEVTGVAPQLNTNVFFRNGSTKINGQLSGVEPNKEDQLFEISKYMVEGTWEQLNSRSDGMIIGSGLATRLGVSMNDHVNILTADNVSRSYKVIGMVTTTVSGVDNAKAFININSARQLNSKNKSYVSDIQVNLKDFTKAPEVAAKYQPKIPFTVEAWQISNGQLEAGDTLRNILAIAVSLTILLVAGFGIYNIMNMTVNEKIREIAILKAMGFDAKDITEIFLVQSIITGLLGGLIGLIFGYVISAIVNMIPFQIANLETLPISFSSIDFVMAFVFGIITTILAGFFPARKASKLDPVEIIRS